MAGTSKIKSLGLAPRIEELFSSGVTTSVAISNALKAEGFNISQPTVSRYLKEERETRREETRTIVQNHVQKTVPTDLKALEDMEAQCLAWAEEDVNAFAHRLAGQHIEEHLESWVSQIYDAANSQDPDSRKIAIKGIMRQCLAWIADDKALQKSRINAMRMAANIIDLKLRYSGIIEGSNEGGIFFVNPASGDRLIKDEKTDRFMVIKGGAD
ncbi:MAG: Arginine repressor, DNA binding domain [Syntrophus sp. PtaB.Bin075]|nr:MAG: Arginine repressor, DNA binding domain [Syntrophus sp. PtaB.Bin075]